MYDKYFLTELFKATIVQAFLISVCFIMFHFTLHRRMFPPIKVQVQDLNPSSFYVLLMDLVPVDKYRYKYQNSQWVKCFEETCSPTRLYVHPESPALGSYWMEHNVSFYKLKLTNNQLDKQGHVSTSNNFHKPGFSFDCSLSDYREQYASISTKIAHC